MNKIVLFVLGFVAIASLLMFFTKNPASALCSGDVLSMTERVEVAIRDLNESAGGVVLSRSQEMKERLIGLNVSTYGQLTAMSQECHILARCLRLKLAASAAESCPLDYQNYKNRTDAVLKDLASIESVRSNIDSIATVGDERSNVEIAISEISTNGLTPNLELENRLNSQIEALGRVQTNLEDQALESLEGINAGWNDF